MNNTFKTVVVLQIIFIAMACYSSFLDVPLEKGSLEQFLKVPCDLLPSMFCSNFKRCLDNRLLCKGKQNYFDDSEQTEQDASRSILFIQKHSASKVEEFLTKRMRSCIKGTFELVAFMNKSFIADNLKKDLSLLQPFLWPAFKEAIKDPITAAFACQYTINPHCRNFIEQVIPETEKECLKTISYIAPNFRQTYCATTLSLAGDNKAVHKCVIINDDLLNDGTFTIDTTATSLIFNAVEIFLIEQNFIPPS